MDWVSNEFGGKKIGRRGLREKIDRDIFFTILIAVIWKQKGELEAEVPEAAIYRSRSDNQGKEGKSKLGEK